jgi:hypothetical protein
MMKRDWKGNGHCLPTEPYIHVRLSYELYFFNQRTVFFSHNESANSTFNHVFSAQRYMFFGCCIVRLQGGTGTEERCVQIG